MGREVSVLSIWAFIKDLIEGSAVNASEDKSTSAAASFIGTESIVSEVCSGIADRTASVSHSDGPCSNALTILVGLELLTGNQRTSGTKYR